MPIFRAIIRTVTTTTQAVYVEAPNLETANNWAADVDDETAGGDLLNEDTCGDVEEITEIAALPQGMHLNFPEGATPTAP